MALDINRRELLSGLYAVKIQSRKDGISMRKPWEYQWDNLSDKDIEEIVSYMKRKKETRGNNPKITNNWNKLFKTAREKDVGADWFMESIYKRLRYWHLLIDHRHQSEFAGWSGLLEYHQKMM